MMIMPSQKLKSGHDNHLGMAGFKHEEEGWCMPSRWACDLKMRPKQLRTRLLMTGRQQWLAAKKAAAKADRGQGCCAW